MDYLISRQAAIDSIEEVDWYHQNKNKDMVSGANSSEHQAWYKADDIYKTLEELPSAQPWTPCSERLPEEENIYLVTFDKSCLLDDEIQVTNALWIDNQWQYDVLESYEHKMPKLVIEPIEELKVIAWMPLPEPYKGDKA